MNWLDIGILAFIVIVAALALFLLWRQMKVPSVRTLRLVRFVDGAFVTSIISPWSPSWLWGEPIEVRTMVDALRVKARAHETGFAPYELIFGANTDQKILNLLEQSPDANRRQA